MSPEAWPQARARYDHTSEDRGQWNQPLEPWRVSLESLKLELRATEFGHVGVFPEQAENWRWIAERVRAAGRSLKILNLFAYTGASTLVAAAAGAEVVHVDAARSTVDWARHNAALSGLADVPVRWIVDDARKFVARELRRGQRYDAVVLDPPSYGHGSRGQAWKLEQDLMPLLDSCAELTRRQPAFMLLSCHSPGYGPEELAALLGGWLPRGELSGADMNLVARDGRLLNAGAAARWWNS